MLTSKENEIYPSTLIYYTRSLEQFESVFSNPEPEILPDFDPNERLPDIHHISITKPGILKLFLNINPKKMMDLTVFLAKV